MQHLKALCDILQSDLDTLAGRPVELSEEPLDVAIARRAKQLPNASKELLLALIDSLPKS